VDSEFKLTKHGMLLHRQPSTLVVSPDKTSTSNMISRLTISLLTVLILTNFASCQNKSQQTIATKQTGTTKFATDNFFKQVLQLDEFKQEEKRLDSISKISQIPIKVSVEIVDNSFLDEDKGKNISLAFINEQYPYERRIMYTIKFDKSKKKIIAII
jgi:hypothetical protein